jgi:hypothetical protein
VVRYEYRFDEALSFVCCCIAASYREEILDGTVFGALTVDGRHQSHLVLFVYPLAVLLRDVGHLVYRGNLLLIEPLSQLPGCEGRHAQSSDYAFQFSRSHSNESFFRIHAAKVQLLIEN